MDTLIITGPVGSDKSTIIGEILNKFPNTFYFSVSHTTRSLYPGEEPDIDYHFINRDKFQNMINNNEFVEYSEINGNYYGTSKAELEIAKLKNKICLLDLDIQGATILQNMTEYRTVSICVVSTSLDDLKRRLKYRGDSRSHIKKVVSKSNNDLSNLEPELYDKSVIIDNLEQGLEEIIEFIKQKFDN